MKNPLRRFFKRSYEAASKSKRLSAWKTPSNRSINSELEGSISIIRARCRDLVVNNPYAKKALDIWVCNVVGTGIRPHIKGNTPFETKLKTWLEDPKLFDVSGELNYYQMQELLFKSIVRDGEVLIRRVFSNENYKAGSIPLKIQILEVDHLDDSGATFSQPDLVQGVEVDEWGKKIAYHISKQHPGNNYLTNFTTKKIRVEASEMLAPKRFDRAGQLRGVSWFTASVIRLKNIDEYEDAELVRQKIAACYVAFVKKAEAVVSGIFGGPTATDAETSELPERMSPGMIEILQPGQDVTIATPPSKEGYDTFLKKNLRGVSVGIGVPYVIMADDLSEVNYSSYRGGLLQFFREVSIHQKNIMIAQFCKPVIGWAKDYSELAAIDGAKNSEINHIAPKKDMIDPSKELPSIIDGIRAGLLTMTDELLEMGKDPDEHFEKLDMDKKRIDALGLILDSDPSNTQKNGAKNIENTTGTIDPNKK